MGNLIPCLMCAGDMDAMTCPACNGQGVIVDTGLPLLERRAAGRQSCAYAQQLVGMVLVLDWRAALSPRYWKTLRATALEARRLACIAELAP